MGECIQDQLAVIDRLAEQKPQYRETLGVYRMLLEIMSKASGSGQAPVFFDLQAVSRPAGVPVFQREALPIDFKASSRVLARFMMQLRQTQREDRPGLNNAIKRLENDSDWGTALFRSILGDDMDALTAFAEEVRLDPGGLEFLARTALLPALEPLRISLSGQIDTENWNYGYCPICGSNPNMACFNESGKRYLQCELCATQWAYQRIGCPFCGHADHENLGYLEPEEEKGLRVYFCKKCLRYIKTVDNREFETPPPLVLQNLVTLHLDLLAHENNYQ